MCGSAISHLVTVPLSSRHRLSEPTPEMMVSLRMFGTVSTLTSCFEHIRLHSNSSGVRTMCTNFRPLTKVCVQISDTMVAVAGIDFKRR